MKQRQVTPGAIVNARPDFVIQWAGIWGFGAMLATKHEIVQVLATFPFGIRFRYLKCFGNRVLMKSGIDAATAAIPFIKTAAGNGMPEHGGLAPL